MTNACVKGIKLLTDVHVILLTRYAYEIRSAVHWQFRFTKIHGSNPLSTCLDGAESSISFSLRELNIMQFLNQLPNEFLWNECVCVF